METHLAPVTGSIDNEEMQQNEPLKVTKEAWSNLKALGGFSPKIDPEDLTVLGCHYG